MGTVTVPDTSPDSSDNEIPFYTTVPSLDGASSYGTFIAPDPTLSSSRLVNEAARTPRPRARRTRESRSTIVEEDERGEEDREHRDGSGNEERGDEEARLRTPIARLEDEVCFCVFVGEGWLMCVL
jgi:hypothetical protein